MKKLILGTMAVLAFYGCATTVSNSPTDTSRRLKGSIEEPKAPDLNVMVNAQKRLAKKADNIDETKVTEVVNSLFAGSKIKDIKIKPEKIHWIKQHFGTEPGSQQDRVGSRVGSLSLPATR